MSFTGNGNNAQWPCSGGNVVYVGSRRLQGAGDAGLVWESLAGLPVGRHRGLLELSKEEVMEPG